MLILTRKPGESLYIGDDIKVVIVEVKGNQIRIGIEAPAEVPIYREEIKLQIQEENKNAASAASDSGLDGLAATWSGHKPGVGRGGRAPSAVSKLGSATKVGSAVGSTNVGSGVPPKKKI